MTPAPIEIVRFVAADLTRAQWSAWHVFRRLRAEEQNPGDPILSDAECEKEELQVSPLWDWRWFVAMQGDEIVGHASFVFRRPDTPHAEPHAPFLNAHGGVLEPRRRQGIGSALLRHGLALMQEMGKTTMTLSAFKESGQAFLSHIGAMQKHSSVENRARFDRLDWPQLRLWEDGIAAEGLTWERHGGRVPNDRLAALMADFTRLIQDIPLGGLDRAPIRYEIENYRKWYETMDRVGGAHHLLLLRDDKGEVVGLTETGWDPRTPDRVWQQLTATDRAWRGRGLARGLKAAMLRQIHEHHPEVVLMITKDAEVNAPMLSINARVGFEVHKRIVDYQVTRDALEAWSASLAG